MADLSATGRRLGLALLAALSLGALGWSLFAWLVMPRLLAAAYEGRGLNLLVEALEHRQSYPLEHYLSKWNGIAVPVLVAWIAAGGLLLLTTSRAFARRCVIPASPAALGAIRIVVCAALAVATVQLQLAEIAGLPDSQRVPMGLMDLLYALGWGQVAHNAALAQGLEVLCLLLGLAGMIGYHTRLVLPLLAILYLPLAGIPRSYFWLNHSGLIPWYCLVVLCVARSGEALSIDRVLRLRRGEPVPRADLPTLHDGWTRLAIWLCICIPYATAGLSKLRFGSWSWWDAGNMQQIFFAQALNNGDERMVSALLALPAWCFTLAGLATVTTEIGMIAVPFSRRARLVLPIAMIVLHLATWLVMDIDFYDLILLQTVFYDWTAAKPSLESRQVIAGRDRRRLAAPAGVAFVIWILAGTWCLRLELYPLTSMQMFSNYSTGNVVDYYRAYVTFADGSTEPARFADMGGGAERYGPVLEWAFRTDKGREGCLALMKRTTDWWNLHHPSRPIVHIETQHRRWDIDRARSDPAAAISIIARLDLNPGDEAGHEPPTE